MKKNLIEIYTDGSYEHPKAGSGIFSKELNWELAIQVKE